MIRILKMNILKEYNESCACKFYSKRRYESHSASMHKFSSFEKTNTIIMDIHPTEVKNIAVLAKLIL